MPSRIGALAGRYILTRLLGEDAAGAVFEGLDSVQDQPVLIKLLPKALAADPARQEQLRRLVARLTALEHPNLLSVVEAGIQEGVPYLVAEGIVATPLAEKMGQALDVEQVASIISQVGEALVHADRQELIHGNLSPQNVLITAGGQVLLSDVGLESVLETPWEKVQEGLTAYLAPERILGERLDARADVYALGVMIFEMITGLRPDGPASQVLPWLREVVPDLAPDLEPVLVRALVTDPEARYATVGEFVADLQPILARYLQPGETPQPAEPRLRPAPVPLEAPLSFPLPPPVLIAPALEGIPAIPMPEPPPIPSFDWDAFSREMIRVPLPEPPPLPEPLPLPEITPGGIEFPTVSLVVFGEPELLAEDEVPKEPLTPEPSVTQSPPSAPKPQETPAPAEPPARPVRRARQPATPITELAQLVTPSAQPVSRPKLPATTRRWDRRRMGVILIVVGLLLMLLTCCCLSLLLSGEVSGTGSTPASYHAWLNIVRLVWESMTLL